MKIDLLKEKVLKVVDGLCTVLGAENIIYGKDLDQKFHHVWKMDEPLKAMALVMPKTTKQVSEIIKICFENNQEVIIHGGLTNLVGATKSKKNQLVISLEKMNEIEEIDQKSRTVTVQSGVILENLINSVSDKGLLLPLNFGAKGSAQIGGAISTNAGGLPEVNITGVSGYMSNVGDIDDMVKNSLEILSDDKTNNKFKENARKQAENYDIHKIVPFYESIYILALNKVSKKWKERIF